MTKKQTAGRDNLGKLAPKFAELNDDVLFGEVWSREKELSPRDRSMITIAALFSAGLYPQLKAHLSIGREHGVTKQEAVELVTQLAFYCGWPKAWSTFPLIQEVYGEEENELDGVPSNLSVFPVGQKNDAFAQYFIGQSYLAPLSTEQVPVYNVTFEPGCRNNWHIHHASQGGGRCSSASAGAAGIRNGGRKPASFTPATWSTSPRVSSTGTAPPVTAGASTWRSKCPVRMGKPNGWSPWTMNNTGS